MVTRSTLFPANARPVSQAAPVLITGAPASTPHSSVQPLTPSGKAFTIAAATTAPVPPVSNLSGIKAIPAVVAGNSAADKINTGSNNTQISANGLASNITGGVNDHLPTATLSPRLTISHTVTADTITPPTASPTGSEKKHFLFAPEIAAIKRRCAANLLSLIPLNIARAFFGAPASSRHDRTCSTTTGSSSSLTTISSSGKSPPALKNEGGGDQATRSSPSPGEQKISSPLQSKSLPASTLSKPGPGSVTAAEQVPRTGDQDDEAEIGPDELYLLETIETDLLDLLADEYCNKHLIYSIIETVLVKVLPELAERSVAELMEDRGLAPVPSSL
ncbi:hypothetical protein N7478_004362 [Penicillium angulare]|uniref:uncharacterized protein n=1 Tax=Penicillium angulare TaxID=116970 RepID=UPI00253F9BBB|nr:uncharacterized protein N7478_004362 [Penicillium angulare]KAJ5278990.1 hypothetical protein N7478_004362 [Penicillium angulare]